MEEPNWTDSPVVAATNHPGILDGALARRFDELIEYRLPDREAAKAIVMHRLGPFNIEANTSDELSDDLDRLSQGELTISADIAVRDAILGGLRSYYRSATSAYFAKPAPVERPI